MPRLGSALSWGFLEDVKFWAPPLGAVAILVFNAPSMPVLEDMVLGILSSTLGAVALLNLLGPGKLTRALTCGAAMFIMKVTGKVYAPAGALASLFMDNAKMTQLGVFYCLTPSLTGTAVLMLLAAARIRVLRALKPTFKRCDPKGELTAGLLPK